MFIIDVRRRALHIDPAFVCALFIFWPLELLMYGNAFAQTAPSVPIPPFLDDLKKIAGSIISDSTFITAVKSFLFAAFGAAATYLSSLFKTRKYKEASVKYETQVNDLSRRLSGVRFGLPEKWIESYNRVLLVGEAGTGKTTLIRNLLSNRSANPRVSTSDLRTYSLVHEIIYQTNVSSFSTSYVCRIDIDDYRGQSLGQILNDWKNDFRPDGALACCSVIFVVDLFAPLKDSDAVLPQQDRWSAARVRHNLAQSPENLIQAIIDKVDLGNLKYVCLFVNKVDLLNNISSETVSEIKGQYQRLSQYIKRSLSGVDFEVIVGSADKGIGVSQLLNRLIEVSAPPGPG